MVYGIARSVSSIKGRNPLKYVARSVRFISYIHSQALSNPSFEKLASSITASDAQVSKVFHQQKVFITVLTDKFKRVAILRRRCYNRDTLS